MNTFNIIDIISKNKINKITNTNNNKLIIKINENFTEEEQKLYVASFYSYLNYDEYKDHIISLDNIWNWLCFSQKVKAKELLLKNFTKDIDYKITSHNTFEIKKEEEVVIIKKLFY